MRRGCDRLILGMSYVCRVLGLFRLRVSFKLITNLAYWGSRTAVWRVDGRSLLKHRFDGGVTRHNFL
jgi:hypothetical protein